jgi:hypothetical protein
MERKKYIRSLRIVADGDLMPLLYGRGGLPFVRLLRGQSTIYRQVGNELKIYRNRQCTVTYPPEATSGFGAWWKDIPNQFVHWWLFTDILCCRTRSIAELHELNNYMTNLHRSASDLQKMSLDEIYEQRYCSTPNKQASA